MVTPSDDVAEVVDNSTEIEETVSTTSSSRRSSPSESYDFKYDSEDPGPMKIFTVWAKPPEEEWQHLRIVAPSYPVALTIAGLSDDTTVREKTEVFEE
tara:strand:- start:718 stop:1011 length:294 start_codon:yes stop_codon:yes gene_type:complete